MSYHQSKKLKKVILILVSYFKYLKYLSFFPKLWVIKKWNFYGWLTFDFKRLTDFILSTATYILMGRIKNIKCLISQNVFIQSCTFGKFIKYKLLFSLNTSICLVPALRQNSLSQRNFRFGFITCFVYIAVTSGRHRNYGFLILKWNHLRNSRNWRCGADDWLNFKIGAGTFFSLQNYSFVNI